MTASQLPDDQLANLRAAVAELEAGIDDDPADAAAALISIGLDLADRGAAFAARVPLEALQRMEQRGLLDAKQSGATYNLLGLILIASGDLPGAKEAFEEALRVSSAIGDHVVMGNGYLNLALTDWFTGRRRSALENLLLALPLVGRGDRRSRAKVQVNLIGLYFDLQDDANARAMLRRLERSRIGREDGRFRAAVLGLRGLDAARQGDLPAAEKLFRQSLHLARAAAAYDHELTALQNLAAVNLDLGRAGIALRRLRQAERLADAMQAFRVLDPIQRTLATALYRVGRGAEARRSLERAASSASARGDQLAWGRISADLGSLALLANRPADAIPTLVAAIDVFIERRDRAWGTKAVLALAKAQVRVGNVADAEYSVARVADQLALAALERAEVYEALGDLLLAPATLTNAKRAYSQVAKEVRAHAGDAAGRLAEVGHKLAELDPAAAVVYFTEAIDSLRDDTVEVSLDQLLNDRALASAGVGDMDAAVADLHAARSAAQARDDRAMLAIVLGNLSELLRQSDNAVAALEFADESVRYARQLGPSAHADALGERGLAELASGDIREARRTFRRTLKLARASGNRSSEAVALGGLASCDFAAAKYQAAVANWEAAAEIEHGEGDSQHETESLAALTETAARLRDIDAADRSLQRLINVVQRSGGPLDVAQRGIARAGGEWFEAEDLETGAAFFVAGVLLAGVETPTDDEAEYLLAMMRPLVSAFVFAGIRSPASLDALERSLARRLRRRLGASATVLVDLLPEARAAARRQEQS